MKKFVGIAVIVIIFLILASMIISLYSEQNGRSDDVDDDLIFPGEKMIYRDYETDNENVALEVAEQLPLPTYLNLSRFKNLEEETNDPSACDEGMCYFDIIDRITIDAYSERFDRIFRSNDTRNCSFKYIIKSETRTDIDIIFDNSTMELSVGEELIFLSGWRSFININNHSSLFNWDSFEIEDITRPSNFSLHLENVYLIDQFMSYVEWSDGYVVYGSSVEQLIILDQDFNPILINVDRLGDWNC